MKKTLGTIAALLAAAAAVIVLGLISVQRMTPDAPSAGDDDVRPAASAAGPDDAYPDFAALAAKFDLVPAERIFVGEQDESPTPDMAAVEPLIARNAAALKLFAAFARRTRFTNPSYADPDKFRAEMPGTELFPVVCSARLSSLRAESLSRQGRAPEALEEALRIADAGQVLLRSDQPIVNAMVGMLVTDIGARRARKIIDGGALDKARLLDAARRLSALRGGARALQAGLRFEYLGTANMLDHLHETAADVPGGRWYHAVAARSRYFFQPLRTRALYAGRFRGLVEEAGKPCLQARPPSHEPAAVDARPNTLGRVLFNFPFPQYEKLYVRRCENEFRVSSAAAAAALAAYRLDHRRRLPAALADLVPGYLASVPIDPFTGAPLLYSAANGEVHSAGKDLDGKAL